MAAILGSHFPEISLTQLTNRKEKYQDFLLAVKAKLR